MIMALMDEYYATDTSQKQKQKDSVHYRHAKGIIVGPIPFGTAHDKAGYLLRSREGVWLLPDGTFVEGHQEQSVPDEKAIWRGFADAALRCLTLYAENRRGRRKLADMLNAEGYRYRDSAGLIVPFNSDDVRRITANWIEYGGAIVSGKAKNRRAKEVTPADVVLNPERAVFDIDLCYRVGEVRAKRTHDIKRNPDYGVHIDATIYPLSKLVYCVHCEEAAQDTGGNSPRTYLTGKTDNKQEARRYRHDTERHCSATKRSVNADRLEHDFLLLLQRLTVNPKALPLLAQALEHFNRQNQAEAQVTAIQAELAYWRQRAKNADILFLKARINEDEWRETIEESEHEIACLQSQIAQQHEAEFALKLTIEMVANLVNNWTQANAEMRRALANSLFEYLV